MTENKKSELEYIHKIILWVAISLIGFFGVVLWNKVDTIAERQQRNLEKLAADETDIGVLKKDASAIDDQHKEFKKEEEEMDHRMTIIETWMTNFEGRNRK